MAFMLIWSIWRGNSLARELSALAQTVDGMAENTQVLRDDIHAFRQENYMLEESLNRFLSDADGMQESALPYRMPDDSRVFTQLEDGTFYLGPVENGIPTGIGLLLDGDIWYFGNFKDGLRDGTFLTFRADSYLQNRQETFVQGMSLSSDR